MEELKCAYMRCFNQNTKAGAALIHSTQTYNLLVDS